MNHLPETILNISILSIGGYYFFLTENKLVKWSIFFFTLTPILLLFKLISPAILVGTIPFIVLISQFICVLLFWIHLSKVGALNYKDRWAIRIFLIPFIIKIVFISFHYPFVAFSGLLSPISIAILIYYTLKYKDSTYLTEELRVMNLFGIWLLFATVNFINFIIDLV